jgi:transposase
LAEKVTKEKKKANIIIILVNFLLIILILLKLRNKLSVMSKITKKNEFKRTKNVYKRTLTKNVLQVFIVV